MDSNLLKTKSIEQLVGDAEHGAKALKRTLTAMDLTLLGIGAIIGTGIFVLTGTAAANQAGPGHRAVVRPRRPGLRLRRAVLRRVRGDDSDLRQRLHLRLRHARRDLRLDDRLGPDPRVRRRVDDRRGRLERLLPADPRRLRPPPAGLDVAPRRRPASKARSSTCRRSSSCSAITALLVIGVRESARFNAVMVAIKLAAILFFIVVGVGYVKPENWSPFMPYGFAGVIAGRGGRLLRLHRLRRRLDDGGRSQEPEPRPADRHHRVAGHLHGALSGGGRHPQRHHPGRAVQGRRAVPQRAGRLRAGGDQQGLGRRPRLGRRRRRHHQRAARHAHEPAAHLLRDEPRPAAAAGRQQGPPEVPHALHHDDHHRRHRRHRRRLHADSTSSAR